MAIPDGIEYVFHVFRPTITASLRDHGDSGLHMVMPKGIFYVPSQTPHGGIANCLNSTTVGHGFRHPARRKRRANCQTPCPVAYVGRICRWCGSSVPLVTSDDFAAATRCQQADYHLHSELVALLPLIPNASRFRLKYSRLGDEISKPSKFR